MLLTSFFGLLAKQVCSVFHHIIVTNFLQLYMWTCVFIVMQGLYALCSNLYFTTFIVFGTIYFDKFVIVMTKMCKIFHVYEKNQSFILTLDSNLHPSLSVYRSSRTYGHSFLTQLTNLAKSFQCGEFDVLFERV